MRFRVKNRSILPATRKHVNKDWPAASRVTKPKAACEPCRHKKVRCDGRRPACSECTTHDLCDTCYYPSGEQGQKGVTGLTQQLMDLKTVISACASIDIHDHDRATAIVRQLHANGFRDLRHLAASLDPSNCPTSGVESYAIDSPPAPWSPWSPSSSPLSSQNRPSPGVDQVASTDACSKPQGRYWYVTHLWATRLWQYRPTLGYSEIATHFIQIAHLPEPDGQVQRPNYTGFISRKREKIEQGGDWLGLLGPIAMEVDDLLNLDPSIPEDDRNVCQWIMGAASQMGTMHVAEQLATTILTSPLLRVI
jgi:hypothetical protein